MRLRDGHLPLRALADLHDGVLPESRRRAAETHLASGCSSCARRRERVARLVAALAEGSPEEMPTAVRAEIHGMLRAAGFGEPLPPGAFAPVLVLDSGALPAAHLRSTAGMSRRVLFRDGPVEIDVEVRACPGGFDVLGQVLRRGRPAASRVSPDDARARAGRTVRRAPVAADGRFTFRALPPGWLVVEVPCGARTAVLRGIHLR